MAVLSRLVSRMSCQNLQPGEWQKNATGTAGCDKQWEGNALYYTHGIAFRKLKKTEGQVSISQPQQITKIWVRLTPHWNCWYSMTELLCELIVATGHWVSTEAVHGCSHWAEIHVQWTHVMWSFKLCHLVIGSYFSSVISHNSSSNIITDESWFGLNMEYLRNNRHFK